ncbi:MAG: hypothetical protein HKP58_11540, partial [Desulfatitalea sp.]|nr:hypothetical protein [Desulfatitalea sp.]
MNLKMYCVGARASADGSMLKYITSAFGSVGMKLAHGAIIEFGLTAFERIFVIDDPIDIVATGSGLSVTMAMMDHFEVSNPPK